MANLKKQGQTLYQNEIRTGQQSSRLPSRTLPDPGVVRAPRGTNPVNITPTGARAVSPLAPTANPRIQNPAINVTPWTTSYAQARSQPKTARANSTYRGWKRTAKSRRGKSQRKASP